LEHGVTPILFLDSQTEKFEAIDGLEPAYLFTSFIKFKNHILNGVLRYLATCMSPA